MNKDIKSIYFINNFKKSNEIDYISLTNHFLILKRWENK